MPGLITVNVPTFRGDNHMADLAEEVALFTDTTGSEYYSPQPAIGRNQESVSKIATRLPVFYKESDCRRS